jgi:hypothetical protein
MRKFTLFSCFFLYSVCASAQVVPGQTFPKLDQYGGLLNVTKPGGGNGQWQLYQWADKRWTWIDPDGHAWIGFGVFTITGATFTRKMDNDGSAEWGPQQVKRMHSLGFNLVGPDSLTYLAGGAVLGGIGWPDDRQPVRAPVINFPDTTGGMSVATFCTQFSKDLFRALNITYYNGWDGGAMPDPYDPCFAATMNNLGTQSGLWVIGTVLGESDWMYGMGSTTEENLGAIVTISNPAQAGTYFSFWPHAFLVNRTNYAKNALVTLLQGRYASIGAFNTAWNSSYTGWGTDGVNHVDSVGTGDGATLTFSTTLSNIPDAGSVWLKVAGVVVAGVSTTGCTTTDTFQGVNVASGTVNCGTKALTITFTVSHAPANLAAITADYYTGGWCHGAQFLDECGANAWMPGAGGSFLDPPAHSNAAMRSDWSAFLLAIYTKWFKLSHDGLKSGDPNALFLGAIVTRGGCFPRPELLQAASGNVDALTLACTNSQVNLDAIGAQLGNVPLLGTQYIFANPDSSMFPLLGTSAFAPGSCSPAFSGGNTQNCKGLQYQAYVDGYFGTAYTSAASPALAGTIPYVTTETWAWADSPGEQTNWGITSRYDNLYDGLESQSYGCAGVPASCASTYLDAWGYIRGGEVIAARTGYPIGTGDGVTTVFPATLQFLPVVPATVTVNSGSTFTQLDADTFSQADENPLSSSGKWTTAPGTSALKLVSHNVEASVATTGNDNMMYRNNITWPNDQYSRVTINAVGGNSRFAGPVVRQSGASLENGYVCQINGGGTNVFVYLFKVVAGVSTRLALINLPVASNDVFQADAIGTSIDCRQNGTIILTATDSDLTSGNAAMVISLLTGDTIANTRITAWSGGSITQNNCTDNGQGTISGATCASGTINYKTGALSVSLNSAPSNGVSVTASFSTSGWGAYPPAFTTLVRAEHTKWLRNLEKELWNPASWTTNRALEKAASASSATLATSGGITTRWMFYDATRAFDGDSNTTWRPAAGDAAPWIRVDAQSTMQTVTLIWGAGFATHYRIETSNDGVSWTTQATNNAGAGGTETFNFTPVTARYIRMNNYDGAHNGTEALAEFQVQ